MRPETGGEAQPAGSPSNDATLHARLAAAEAQAEALRSQIDSSESLASSVARQSESFAVERELVGMQAEMEALRSNRLLRLSQRLRRGVNRSRSLARGAAARLPPSGSASGTPTPTDPSTAFPEDRRYPEWVALYDTVDDDARDAVRRRLAALSATPLVSVILPVFNTPEPYLRDALDSIRAQLYPNWELCIADDCSTAAWVPKVLEEYVALDSRIRVEYRAENGHISAASNTALAMARGEWVALFDHDDVMAEHALALSVLALDRVPGAGILYSDEDHVDDDAVRSSPYFKPDYDPVLLLGQNYFSHLSVLRRDLIEQVGGYRVGLEGSQDWDLVLRVVELLSPEQVVHVPHVLYHWRSHPGSTAYSTAAKPYAAVAARRAVQDHLDRAHQAGRALPIGGSGFNRVRSGAAGPTPGCERGGAGPHSVPAAEVPRLGAHAQHLSRTRVGGGGRRRPPPTAAGLPPRPRPLAQRGARRARRERRRAAQRGGQGRLGRRAVLRRRRRRGRLRRLAGGDGGPAAPAGHRRRGGEAPLPPGLGAARRDRAGHRGDDRTRSPLHRPTRARALRLGHAQPVLLSCLLGVHGRAPGGLRGGRRLRRGAPLRRLRRRRPVPAAGGGGLAVGWTPFAEMLHHESPKGPPETWSDNSARLAREIRYLHTRSGSVLERDPAYNPNLSLAHETSRSLGRPAPRTAKYGK